MDIKIKCTQQEFGRIVRACATSASAGGCYNCIIGISVDDSYCCEGVEDACAFEVVAGDSDG